MSTDGLPEQVRAANREAARRDVAAAPPLKDWQIAVLGPLFAPRRPRRRRAA